jgi:hydroxyacylglutathione hydrolase
MKPKQLVILICIVMYSSAFAQTNSGGEFFKKVKMGANAYIIGNNTTGILIDAGTHNKFKKFKSALEKIQKSPEWIKYIIITHTHYDHVANLSEIQELTGAQIIIHKDEARFIESGYTTLPDGMNSLGRTGRWFVDFFNIDKTKVEPVIPDIRINSSLDLRFTGLNLVIIPTPGHSVGSLSVIWNDTIAFCGDAAFAVVGFDVYPVTGNNPQNILNSWKVLLNLGCKVFFPGHGRKFNDERLQKSLEKHIDKQVNQ